MIAERRLEDQKTQVTDDEWNFIYEEKVTDKDSGWKTSPIGL